MNRILRLSGALLFAGAIIAFGGCSSSSDNSGGDNGTGTGCKSDFDCPSGQVCKDGSCVTSSGGGCTSDADCPSGQVCNNGTCTTGGTGCQSDFDCPSGQICQNGTCTSNSGGCTSDADCPSGQVCNNGTCTSGGGSGGNGSQLCSQASPNCPSPQQCLMVQGVENGLCTIQCTPNGGECGSNENCDGILKDQNNNTLYFCYTKCTSDADCPTGFSCLPPSQDGTYIGGECLPSDWFQGGGSGFCYSATCSNNTQCPQGQLPVSLQGQQGTCFCVEDCTQTGTCSNGGQCQDLGGAKACLIGCNAASDCPNGWQCYQMQ